MAFPIFDKKEEIPKGFEGDYEQREGKWHPKLPDVGKLEETLGKLRDDLKVSEKARKDADDARAEAERKLVAADAKGGDVDKKVSDALKKFDADLAKAKDDHKKETDTLQAKLRQVTLTDRLKDIALKAGVLPARVDAVLKLTDGRFDLADGDRIVVKGDKGEVTTEKPEDFFGKTYKAQMPELYQGTKAAGGGAGGGAGTGAGSGQKWDGEAVLKNPLGALEEANAGSAK